MARAAPTSPPPESEKERDWTTPALAAASLATAAGAGALVYHNWEAIKRLFKWGQMANDAAADSAVLLETKLDHAIAISAAPQADLVSLKHAVDLAIEEARNLVAINQQLRDRLKKLTTKPMT